MTTRVRITDVSPRDGLQNEVGVIATSDKAELVRQLCACGMDEVEVTSFVSAKWVPQLGDAAEVFEDLAHGAWSSRSIGKVLSALVPNERGMSSALEVVRKHAGLLKKVSVFTAASETFARKNTNATIAETIERFGPVIESARREGLLVRGYVSCVVACPFEGPIAPARVAEVAGRLLEIGVDELDLGDTIGAGTPESVEAMLDAVNAVWRVGAGTWPTSEAGLVTLHLHDTFGRAADCVKAALRRGVRSFDGSVAGLGGCPYASTPGKRAPGNIDTLTLVRTVRDAGYETKVDLPTLERVADLARTMVGRARSGS